MVLAYTILHFCVPHSKITQNISSKALSRHFNLKIEDQTYELLRCQERKNVCISLGEGGHSFSRVRDTLRTKFTLGEEETV